MKKYIRNIAVALVCFLVVVVLNFALPRMLPGDPIAYLTGMVEEDMTPAQYAYYEEALHLNESGFRQFAYYIQSLLDGTLGYSYKKEAVVSALIGERVSGIPNNLMPYITQVAAGIREKLLVYGNDYPTPDGTGVRDYVHVTDLARGHVAALRYTAEHTGTEIINLGTGKGCSVLELLQAFENANHVTVPYEIVPRRAGDIAACYADTEKARRLLGWKAEKSLEDMCRDSWRWQQNCKE